MRMNPLKNDDQVSAQMDLWDCVLFLYRQKPFHVAFER
jgi:hypothetical protein